MASLPAKIARATPKRQTVNPSNARRLKNAERVEDFLFIAEARVDVREFSGSQHIARVDLRDGRFVSGKT